MLNTVLNFLFPRLSLTGGEGEWITADELCALRSSPVIINTPELRSHGMHSIDRIVASADYRHVPLLRNAVHTFKYRKMRGVGESLGILLTDASMVLLPPPPTPPPQTPRCARSVGEGSPVLCPVPLHWIRKFSRGFNQAEVLARIVSASRGWPVRNLLRRSRWTGSQVGRTRAERLIGVRDAFTVEAMISVPSYVVLIDDVSTTGSTLDVCAKTLKAAGVKNVEGLVIARG